jgi:EpsI family protein
VAHRAPNYLLVIVMMALTLVSSVAFSRRPEAVSAAADVRVIPRKAGDWTLQQDVRLDENVMRQILADSYVNRRYVNPEGQMVELLVVYRRYGRREFAHRPELCFPAAGYQIARKDRTTLFYGGREVGAIHLKATAPGVPAANISYFFASGRKTEEDFLKQQVWMAFERLIPNKNGWTFIRLTSPTITTDEAAMAAQKDFMRDFAPAIEAAITTDTAAGQRTAQAGLRPAP